MENRMSNQDLIISTSNTLDGYEIIRYLGIVNTHIVAGTGFFSDLAASFTDIFGGRSDTYQKQLQMINDEAIESLEMKAKRLGANAIIGISIDHDEISGKGMQMFMVSVYGTAVRANQFKQNEFETNNRKIVIEFDEMNREITKQKIVLKSQTIPNYFSQSEWEFILNNNVSEIAIDIVNTINYWQENINNRPIDYDDMENNWLTYFEKADCKYIKGVIYDSILKYPNLFTYFYNIINQLNICDYDKISAMLDSKDVFIRKQALMLLNPYKNTYEEEDIGRMNNITSKINLGFKIEAKYIEEKAIMSSKMKKKWVCICGRKNDIENEKCSECGRDIYGFTNNEINPLKALNIINERKNALISIFNQEKDI
jgi:uncharacterized protein YbjQ (UPF0145 family)